MRTLKPPPDWAIPVRYKMLVCGISNHDVALRLGKSDQWTSNVLTGFHQSKSMQDAICACVDEMVNERQKAG